MLGVKDTVIATDIFRFRFLFMVILWFSMKLSRRSCEEIYTEPNYLVSTALYKTCTKPIETPVMFYLKDSFIVCLSYEVTATKDT